MWGAQAQDWKEVAISGPKPRFSDDTPNPQVKKQGFGRCALSIPDLGLFKKQHIIINDVCLCSHGVDCQDQVGFPKGVP